jgi:excisionase family DNA binding protein
MVKTKAGAIVGNVPEKLVMSVPEAGAKLGLSRESAYRAVREGSIPAIRIGNLWKVPVVQLERLLNGK